MAPSSAGPTRRVSSRQAPGPPATYTTRWDSPRSRQRLGCLITVGRKVVGEGENRLPELLRLRVQLRLNPCTTTLLPRLVLVPQRFGHAPHNQGGNCDKENDSRDRRERGVRFHPSPRAMRWPAPMAYPAMIAS